MKKRLFLGISVSLLLMAILVTALVVTQGTTQAAYSWPTLSNNSSGENVRTIQYLLRQRGYSIGADGQYGPQTMNAVKSFQTKNGLKPVDGVVGPVTWAKLILTLRNGSKGEAVTALQRQLSAHGISVVADGDFGTKTTNAVVAYQKKVGLSPADGIVGIATWNKLITTGASSSGVHRVDVAPTISAAFINQVLAYYGSPANGKGQAMYNLGKKYSIDPAYALAFFNHESSFGKNGVAKHTKSLGNILCTSKDTSCYNNGTHRFRKYSSWEEGFEAWFRLIRNTYINKWQRNTVETIIPKYAPSNENNVHAYINSVVGAVTTWRSGRVRL